MSRLIVFLLLEVGLCLYIHRVSVRSGLSGWNNSPWGAHEYFWTFPRNVSLYFVASD